MLDRLKLQHLRYFIAVAEELHFSRAAQKVALSEWDLSEQVRNLEDMLGVTLLVRHPHQMELTPAGDLLLRGANDLLKDTLQLLKQVQDLGETLQDQIRLGYSAPELEGFLPPLLGQWISTSDLNLSRVHVANADLLQALLDHQIDVALGPAEPLEHPDLEQHDVATGHWGVVLPETHPLAELEQLAAVELQQVRLLLLSGNQGNWLQDAFANRGVEMDVIYRPAQPETAEVMVEQGSGLWPTSSLTAENLPPGLVFRPLAGFPELRLVLAGRAGEGVVEGLVL